MFRSGLRKIWRDVSARKSRTFLVSASIFVGVLGVIALFTTSDVLRRQLERDVNQDKLTMIDVTVNVPRNTSLDNAQYLATLNRENAAGQAIPALEGIEIVEGWAYYFANIKRPDNGRYAEIELRAYFKPLSEIVLEPLQLIEGAWPQANAGEVALEKRMAEAFGFSLGDTITFRGSGANGAQDVDYRVVGIVFHPYSARNLAGDMPGPDIGVYLEFEDVQSLLGVSGLSRFVARYETFEQAQANFEGFVAAISDYSPYNPLIPAIENPAQNQQIESAAIYATILNSLALAAMIVSGFLVVNVVNTIIAEQKQQVGILKSVGANQTEMFLIYCGIALTYGFIGTAAAILPALGLAQLLTSNLATQIDVLVEGFNWSLSAILIGVALGLIVPVLAAAIPVYNGTRLSIMEAITNLGIKTDYGLGLIPRLIARLPLPISIRQALSNVYQKRWRLALTGITLTVTIGTFMGTTALTTSIANEIDNLFGRLGYEIIATPNEIQDPAEMQAILNEVDFIESIAPASIVFIQLPGDYVNFFTGDNQVQIFGLDPTTNTLDFTYIDGEGWANDPTRRGIVVSQSISGQLDLSSGDMLDVVVGGKPHTIEVLAIDRNAFDAANMRWDHISELAGIVYGAPSPNQYIVEAAADTLDESVFALGMDETLLSLVNSAYDPQAGGVIISSQLAVALDLLGDEERISLNINGETIERDIRAIVPNAVLENSAAQIIPSLADVPQYVVLFGFNDLLSITGESTAGEPVPNGYYISLENGTELSADEVADYIFLLEERLLAAGIPARYTNQTLQGDLSTQQASAVNGIFLSAAVMIAGVGAIGLLTTLTISVFERQKEIGVMRSIGASSGSIAFQFIIEGAVVGFISWLIGLPLSYFIALAFNAVANLENIPFTYPLDVPILGLIGMLVLTILASAGPALNAANKTVSDILRYQ